MAEKEATVTATTQFSVCYDDEIEGDLDEQINGMVSKMRSLGLDVDVEGYRISRRA